MSNRNNGLLQPSSRRRKRSTFVASVTLGLASLMHSEQCTITTRAFTSPQSTMRSRFPQHSLAQLRYSEGATDSPSNQRKSPSPLPRLTHAQEVALLRKMRSHPVHSSIYQKARQTLITRNLPLVHSIVTKIMESRLRLRRPDKSSDISKGTALTRGDLVNEGTIGLAEAVDKYDLAFAYRVVSSDDSHASSVPKKLSDDAKGASARLGTYATYWIRARIIRAIHSREHPIRFPEHVLQASHRLVKTAKEFGLRWDLVTELAEFDVICVNQEKLRDELRLAAGIKSDSLFLEAVRVRGMTTTHLESWMSPASKREEDKLLMEAGSEHIRETLAKFLGPREVDVLSLRYGLVSREEKKAMEEELVAPAPTSIQPQRVFRDYEAEAEEDLFGPKGILSHYSVIPNDNLPVVSKVKSRIQPPKCHAQNSDNKIAIKSPALLPFKEIGKRMKFSGEYCRRTCSIALKKLTQAAEEGHLAEADFLLGF